MSDKSSGLLTQSQSSHAIRLVRDADYVEWLGGCSSAQQALLARQGFEGKPGQVAWLDEPNHEFVVGWDGADNLASLGSLPTKLPPGEYHLASPVSELQVIGWGLGAYQFNRYKNPKREPAQLVIPDDLNADRVEHSVRATAFARDLINTSAADMAPSHLAAEAQGLAERFGAECTITVGDELLDRQCGAIHAVGRAAIDEPRLIELTWGESRHPTVTLVGKGVTFDSGGLDLKSASGMRLMKKDMGGAAITLGLAYLIMAQNLAVHLRVLVPAAENAVAGNAFRPGDVLATHKGLTVEIDNTDAEGRLLLCDALSIASEENPEVIFDFATLTGSARSAVGTEIAAMFCNDDELALALAKHGEQEDDPVWRMPLHASYRSMLKSSVADLVNSASSPYAGSITAALYLEHFVGDAPWAHFDLMAFNTKTRPGHPEGGEAMALRTVFAYLEKRYGAA